MRTKPFFAFVVFVVVLLLISCTETATPESEEKHFKESPQICGLKLLTLWDGTCYGSSAENGYYYVQAREDGSINVLYMDYASKTRTVLCATPNCEHDNEMCTGWISSKQGGVVPLSTGEKLFLVSRGNDMVEPYIARPQVIQMDLNGDNRKQLLQLDANEELVPPFLGNDNGIVCVYKNFQNTESGLQREEAIVYIDVKTGDYTKLFSSSQEEISIVGLTGDFILIQRYTAGKGSDLYTFNVNTNEMTLLKESSGSQEKLFYTDLGYGTVDDQGKLYFYRAPEFKKEALQNLQIPLNEEWGLETLTFRESFDDKVIFEIFNPGETPAESTKERYGLSIKNNTLRELTLQTDFGGVKEPIEIIAYLQDRLLVASNLSLQDKLMIDKDGSAVHMDVISKQYSLISKTDFWNSIPNYEVFEDLWF